MQYRYGLKVFLLMVFALFVFAPFNTHALNNNKLNRYSFINILDKTSACADENDKSIFGNVECEDSVAWLLQKILNYIRVIGPSIAVVLTIIDFTTAIVSSSDDSMKKVKIKFRNRLIAVLILFFIPTITMILLDLIGLTNTTGGIT